jgi:hypothetical protein
VHDIGRRRSGAAVPVGADGDQGARPEPAGPVDAPGALRQAGGEGRHRRLDDRVVEQLGLEPRPQLGVGVGELVQRAARDAHSVVGARVEEEPPREELGDPRAPYRLARGLERLEEAVGGRGAGDHRLRPAQVEEHLGASRLVEGLVEGPAKRGDRRLRRAAAERGVRRGAKGVERPRLADRAGGDQLRGDPIRPGAGLLQELGRPPVRGGPLARSEVGADRLAHQRVDELQRRPRPQELRLRQEVRRRRGAVRVQPGQATGHPEVDVRAEHGHRARQAP